MVGVGTVKNRQAFLLSEADLAKRAHQLSQVSRAEHRLRSRVQRPQVHHRVGDAPFPAHAGQFGEGRLAGGQIEMALRAESDEFTGPDDLEFLWRRLVLAGLPG
jgi:hypothetical protein